MALKVLKHEDFIFGPNIVYAKFRCDSKGCNKKHWLLCIYLAFGWNTLTFEINDNGI